MLRQDLDSQLLRFVLLVQYELGKAMDSTHAPFIRDVFFITAKEEIDQFTFAMTTYRRKKARKCIGVRERSVQSAFYFNWVCISNRRKVFKSSHHAFYCAVTGISEIGIRANVVFTPMRVVRKFVCAYSRCDRFFTFVRLELARIRRVGHAQRHS